MLPSWGDLGEVHHTIQIKQLVFTFFFLRRLVSSCRTKKFLKKDYEHIQEKKAKHKIYNFYQKDTQQTLIEFQHNQQISLFFV